ncbi:MAG TPA: mechanosensitive ion channel family protein [Polyangiaceae bacterium]
MQESFRRAWGLLSLAFALAAPTLSVRTARAQAVAGAAGVLPTPTPSAPTAAPAPRPSVRPAAPRSSVPAPTTRVAPPAASSAPLAAPPPSASASPVASALASAEPAASAEPPPSAEPPIEPVPSAAPVVVSSAPSIVPPPPLAAPSAAPPPPAPIGAGTPVNLGDEPVFAVRVARGGKTPAQRAADATKALNAAAHQKNPGDVRWERRGDVALVLVGQTPIAQLTQDDATAAGDSSLEVHAASVVSSIREAIESEQRRSALAQSVFSFSLLVFLGLIVFYLVRKVGEFGDRARLWIDEHGERVLAVRVRQVELLSPGTVKSTAQVGLSLGQWIAQLGIVYAWLVVVLSLFDATRGYTERLTGFVVSPLSQLMTRLVTGLPVLLVFVIAGFAVFVLVRFVGLFFDAVARGETAVAWLARDLAAPTSAIVRFGLVLGALIFLAPLVSGTAEGPVGRSGAILFAALGLASTPFLANGLLGAVTLFGRRLRTGQHVEIGAFGGRIASIGLLEIRLEDASHCEVRVPHLYVLRHPLRVLGLRAPVSVDVAVATAARHPEVRDLLRRTGASFDVDARVELVSADADCARYRLSLASDRPGARSDLQMAVLEALADAHVPLGRLSP